MKLFVAVILALALATSANEEKEKEKTNEKKEILKVKVDVYYESLCPDSKKFITTQLHPALQNKDICDHIDLDLIPYGKSSYKSEEDKSYSFTCHHGPQECHGNKIHACALKNIENDDKEKGFSKIKLDFVNCLMANSINNGTQSVFPTEKCAQESKVGDVKKIDDCAKDKQGSEELHKYGTLTEKLEIPKEKLSMPTIVFGKKYTREDSDLAQEDFTKALCKHFEGEKPKFCS